MNFETTLVVLDTCVLLPPRVSDVLMDLRKERLFSAHWTVDIDDEYLRNMQKLFSIPEVKARRRLSAMKKRCPEWEVLATSEDFERVPDKVDERTVTSQPRRLRCGTRRTKSPRMSSLAMCSTSFC